MLPVLYLLKIIHCTNMSMKNRDTVILLPARNTVTIADSIIYSRLVKKKNIKFTSCCNRHNTEERQNEFVNSSRLFKNCWWSWQSMCLSVKDILQNCSLPSDTNHKALAISKSRTVVLKRTPAERNITNYDPDILKYLEVNMDLQYVCDPYSCVVFIWHMSRKTRKRCHKC